MKGLQVLPKLEPSRLKMSKIKVSQELVSLFFSLFARPLLPGLKP
jgi:hypothetical protein